MKLSRRYQARGLFRIVRGTAKAIAGKIWANRKMAVTGRVERQAGRLQFKVGKVQGMCGL